MITISYMETLYIRVVLFLNEGYYFSCEEKNIWDQLKDLYTPSAGSEFKINSQWLQELNFTTHLKHNEKYDVDSPPPPIHTKVFKEINEKFQNTCENC